MDFIRKNRKFRKKPNLNEPSLRDDIARLWEIENLGSTKPRSPEEQKCEDLFVSTHTRTPEGRYVAHLPFKENHPPIGDTRSQAVKRLYSIERRLDAHPALKIQYEEFMDEYLGLHHMEEVPPEDLNNKLAFYLTHHFVLKDSSTTALRTVFDGSAKSSTGVSINDILMIGEKVEEDLVDIFLRWRLFKIGISADIAKVCRQTLTHLPHANLQRIVWRKDRTRPPTDYRLLTATHGAASASHSSTRSLKQLSIDEEPNFPIAAPIVRRDFYSDNALTGAHTTEDSLILQKELIGVCAAGQMQLRKWSSNDPSILAAFPESDRETALPLDFEAETTKALGVVRGHVLDNLKFKVKPYDNKPPTKRIILSNTAKVFDPIGLLSTCTIIAKLLIQSLWSQNVDWDTPIEGDSLHTWTTYVNSLQCFEKLQIPTFVNFDPSSPFELHGFSDSSERAYCACIHIRVKINENKFSSYLLQAKVKVAPLKFVSLPRLELCGALLLSRLMNSTIEATKTKPSAVHLWSDSTIVLHWINSPASRWKVFVANRISEIQEASSASQWHHVPTKQNPADLPTRGLAHDLLPTSSLWWFGPSWLTSNELPINPIPGSLTADSKLLEEKTPPVLVHSIQASSHLYDLINRCHSLDQLKRVTAYVQRFVHNLRNQGNRMTGFINTMDLQNTFNFWIILTRNESFHEELQSLKEQLPLHKKRKLLHLSPFIDPTGILRVGGRLKNSSLIEKQKYPIVLPRKHPLTRLIIRNCHRRLLHAGRQLMIADLHQQFWILNCRDAARAITRSCLTCARQAAIVQQQFMGSLPDSRVTPVTRPFYICGTDLAGPYSIVPVKGRGRTTIKMWFVIFICFSTKAVHLEYVNGMSKEGFIACLRRFISRRGTPHQIWSDQGTNIIGANNDIKDLDIQFTELLADHDLQQELSNNAIEWHFYPPGASHMGGLWEANVESVKFHSKRAATAANFTIEEVATLLCQIEACLNSRPLTAMSTDPSDFQPLTPGHFLGRPLTSLHESDLTKVKLSHLDRWQLIQRQVQEFWHRWSSEYLHTLQPRSKWVHPHDKIQVNYLVLIKDEWLPLMKWKTGRVSAIHPGSDEKVRVVTLKIPHVKIIPGKRNRNLTLYQKYPVTTSELQRTIHKLIKLPVHLDQQPLNQI